MKTSGAKDRERDAEKERERLENSLQCEPRVKTGSKKGWDGGGGGGGGGETQREKLEKRVDYFTAIRADRKRRGQ